MNRLMFRVWDKKELVDRMIYLTREYLKERQGNLQDFLYSDRFIPMQYTGLEDKNNKPIFAGDIVKYKIPRYDGDYCGIGEVKWINSCFKVYDLYLMPELNSAFMEIIGNIYEHKHLLTEGK